MAALTPQNEPKVAEYAGDEVSALVLDPGYSSVRAGFAGEDTPKSIIPSYYGDTGDPANPRLFGDHVIDRPRENMAIKNPLNKDGLVEDWDAAEALWLHSFAAKLTGLRPNKALQEWLNNPENVPNLQQAMREAEDIEKPLEDHPLFMTESGWNTAKAREKCAEIAMESWGAPAFYIGRQGVMAAFASGKATALIVDVGASNTSVTPVHDGIILKKSIQRSHLAGNFISSQIRNMLASNQPQPITITPHYLIKSKTPVDAGQPANAVLRDFPSDFTPPQASFRRYQEERTLLEFKELVVQVWPGPTPLLSSTNGVTQEEIARGYPGKTFEFPDGYNQLFTSDRYKVAESLFDHRAYIAPPPTLQNPDTPFASSPPTAEQTLTHMIRSSLSHVDVDIRPLMLANVVVTGGSSLIPGFTERLNNELQRMFPSTRVRLQAAGNSPERKFGSWIGGSIMASLGTFHQMWISRKEFEEHGSAIVEKRCK
ncbi:Actin-related protein 4 [Endocarpon pusillum Z07020]|uniref:Actin-related protein 4 n=1 Tax=Endocarpon pusillum (strain Z07020 / HMAS-L-300199) TaxID=1263415 RepID=U1HTA4_ENDPU|nr:Actin-related protein 4 [Endocarpon pusillum Z07020]ERF72484.1 Actin-related protein 4 [Endocarpon pusillum Z07020]